MSFLKFLLLTATLGIVVMGWFILVSWLDKSINST